MNSGKQAVYARLDLILDTSHEYVNHWTRKECMMLLCLTLCSLGIISEIVACVFPVQIDVDSLAVAPKIYND